MPRLPGRATSDPSGARGDIGQTATEGGCYSCRAGSTAMPEKARYGSRMNWRAILRSLLAVFFVAAGANHFRDPAFYRRGLPSGLPWHQPLIDLSGGAEILGGIGVLVPRTRRAAGWGLIALLIAVFPANVFMALRNAQPPKGNAHRWVLWVRLPLQAVLIAWAWWTAAAKPRENSPG